MQVTDSLGQVHISDSFDPGGLGGLSMQFKLDIYRGGAGAVTAELGGGIYTVRTKSGSLEVRYVVENMSGNPVYGVSAALSEPLPAGEAAVTAPAGTSYMLNDTDVPASGTGVGLLFDGLYDGSGSLEALRARVERIMGGAVKYEARYLDLVDADDGNAWVTASGPVTVHWGYPEGTDEHTSFTLLHFAGLHRSVQLLTDDVIANWPKVDNVPVRNTENGLSFEVTPGGFSPFVLVWEEGQSSVTPPVTTPVTPPAALNTKDHFAYMIGYEDGTIRPGNGITRAEAATIFFRLLTDEALSGAEIVFVCLYPGATVAYVREKAALFAKGALVVDCSGVKTPVCEPLFPVARAHGFVFVGGHPMAGKETSGYAAAEAGLFRGASMILVPDVDSGLGKLSRLCTELGFGRVVVTTAALHDRTIAYTSQLAHIVSSAYVKSETARNESGFSAGSFRDLTRVAYLNEEMWTELFLDNRGPLCDELRTIIAHLQEYLDALEAGDPPTLRALLKDGRERKTAIENADRTRLKHL